MDAEPDHEGTAGPLDPPAGRPPLEPFHVQTVKVLVIGTSLWVVALVVTLFVPWMHQGARSWWPWACLAGAGLGLIGLLYLRRGRGNAAQQ